MNETDARRIARERSIALEKPFVATTRDKLSGHWERTNEWGVLAPNGMFATNLKDFE